ncbi:MULTISPECIES: glyceraldehyde-3-phosphate dehydrogenase [Geobacillus]|jgi:glyceraldehyde 3-phosphate dehydrogenase|uniref:Glyceraldehyde-3-phosphate dehydrogenase n=2 Tax=Geobacillus thermodenitrificans TaxID=33940 RepID=A4IRP2_GEOTN|nr:MULTISPECIES: glyceraldehyde-3-phosphate dehydrogenase [Geobacillus]ABO67996.1 Glyceraldehyde 3-phosphate dehydrogenase [Geobacillus thermodenitrificans NG80-2]ARA98843.1 type I glyceraldehyde-3-phosphate dehydrogenase [Geobacillus thermodenitrificans]ARP43743.1 Glyceraldehyde-3-phosphate dehydrogenase 2 [Geobacillus thermodenitrificans]ATO38210.1 type I glyceraldehyde-3-phosphate dehydrogenase [Geobacillus thermodenitrificans]KQB92291.1 Glyceraldehyde-3-phosphate dehydrogenase 2 [Geobacill
MKAKVAINGFGRIGRMVFRRAINSPDLDIVAVNASYPPETLAHLVKYDSNHGKFDGDVTALEDGLLVNGKKVKLLNSRDPQQLPWKELDIDIVIEATGKFNSREKASLHLDAGAKRVILTAPGKNEDVTIVVGVNEQMLDIERHFIISNASCTTNCLAPVVKVLDEAFGIENGLMTTVHAYTNDQKNIDNPHKDLRRARSCAQSIIPTTTGAAKALGLVLPHLKGKLHGMALRVPTPNVSLVDLVVDVKRDVTIDEVNEALLRAANGPLKGILEFTMEPLVSIDFNTNPHSAIIDGLSTMVIDGRKVKVLAWYDNEWGYSCRVVDLAHLVAAKMNEHLHVNA